MYQDPQNEVHSRGPAHVTNPNLSRPALVGKTSLPRNPNSNPVPQLGFSQLILPLRRAPTCLIKNLQHPNQLGPASLLPLLTAHETALAPCPSGRVLSPGGQALYSLNHGSSSLWSRTSNSLLNCLSCHWTCPRSTVLPSTAMENTAHGTGSAGKPWHLVSNGLGLTHLHNGPLKTFNTEFHKQIYNPKKGLVRKLKCRSHWSTDGFSNLLLDQGGDRKREEDPRPQPEASNIKGWEEA